jgi:FkbM family methyltransferase
MVAGTFEPDEIEILREMLPRTDRFVDVGANIGYYTCIARHMNKPVIAFEPLEMNLMLLYANLHENGWLDTEVWPLGLADYVGMAPLFGSDTGASLIPGWAKQTNSLTAAICINTFDHVVGDRFTGERLLVKIDVEGFEMAVLRGGVNLFDRAVKPVVMIEIALLVHHPVPNKNYRATFEFFWSRNYRIVTADKQRREVSARDVEGWEASASCDWNVHNWLAIPEGF